VALAGLRRLLASRPLEMIQAGDLILREHSTSHHFYEIVSGCVRRLLIKPDGRRSIIDFLFAGDFFGDLLEGEHSLTAEAVTDLEIRRISRTQLHSVQAQFPHLENELLALAWHDLSAAQHHVVLLGANTARARVAMFLLGAAKWSRGPDRSAGDEIDLPMSRLDIADFLGLTIESVSRVLTQFKVSGVISVRGIHKIELKNVAELQRLAGEDDYGM
jgi:CRP-like cAMP-binding protein